MLLIQPNQHFRKQEKDTLALLMLVYDYISISANNYNSGGLSVEIGCF